MKSLNLFFSSLLATATTFSSSIASQVPLSSDISLPSLSAFSNNPTSALLSLHKHLVEIESITQNEANVADYLGSYLESLGLTVETQKIPNSKNRSNLYAYLGTTRKTKVLISSHIDTVPPFWPYEVKAGKTKSQDEIWGRGTVDAKGSVAAQIAAYAHLANNHTIKEGDVALLFVVGEETGGDGMRTANDLGISWEAVIFGEPTELKLASGHKGNLGFTLTAHGKAGHSGYPELGRNANLMLVKALYELDRAVFPSSGKYGNTTLNIGVMSGGVAGNVIAETAKANVAMRLAAGEPADSQKVVLAAVERAGYGDDLVVDFTHGYGPIAIDHDVAGFDEIVVNYGTDIPNLKGDHKRYLYGPGDILVAHSDHEHLTVADLETAVAGYKKLITATLAL